MITRFEAMHLFMKDIFPFNFEEFDLFSAKDWDIFYESLIKELEKLEVKRKTVIKVRYCLLEDYKCLERYNPTKNGFYSFRVVAKVLAETMRKDRYSRSRVKRLVVDGLKNMRCRNSRARIFSPIQFYILGLSVRSENCLDAAGVETIGDLVRMTELQLLECRNFGQKSLNEIKAELERIGLSLEMILD